MGCVSHMIHLLTDADSKAIALSIDGIRQPLSLCNADKAEEFVFRRSNSSIRIAILYEVVRIQVSR